MSSLYEILKEFDNVPKETKTAISKVIEYQIDINMEKVLAKIDALQIEMKSIENRLENKIVGVQIEMKSIENRLENRIVGVQTEMRTEIKSLEKDNTTIKWMIGIAVAIIVAFISFKN